MHPPPPWSPARKLSRRDRLVALRNIWRPMGMLGKASPALVPPLAADWLFGGVLYPAMLRASERILAALVGRIGPNSGTLRQRWKLAGMELALAVASSTDRMATSQVVRCQPGAPLWGGPPGPAPGRHRKASAGERRPSGRRGRRRGDSSGGPFEKQRPLRGTVRVTAGRGTDEARYTAPRRAKEREE
jgi:hypothetical protein